MSFTIERFLLLIASSPETRQEVQRFFKWIERVGADRASEGIIAIRAQAKDIVDPQSDSTTKVPEYFAEKDELIDQGILIRVQDLVLDRTGLTKGQAADLLLRELEKMVPVQHLPLTRYNKQSFDSWLIRIGAEVGFDLLLRAASHIRNRISHGGSSAWPLREPK